MTKICILLKLLLITGCWTTGKSGETKNTSGGSRKLNADLAWDKDNRQSIDRFIAKSKNGSSRLAIFDWDNTVIKNDIGDGTTFYMLLNNKIVKPKSWAATSRHLTSAALASLDKHCPLNRKGRFFPTSTDKACATAILCIYYEATTWDGLKAKGTTGKRCSANPAFKLKSPANPDTIEPGYAWTVALQAGHNPNSMREIATKAYKKFTTAPIGAKISIGYAEGLNGFIRVYPQIKDLIGVLRRNKFDVWVSTASSQFVVDAIAPTYVGIPASKVIGVKPVLKDDIITPVFRGCGTFTDSQDLINYRQGKRCWINKIIHEKSESQQLSAMSSISFSAGDSDTDAFFLMDTNGLRLVINRNKKQVMCNALENIDGKWLINAMFIEPKKTRLKPYSCSKYKNVKGKIIPPQKEI